MKWVMIRRLTDKMRADPFLAYLDAKRSAYRKALEEIDVTERVYLESGIMLPGSNPEHNGRENIIETESAEGNLEGMRAIGPALHGKSSTIKKLILELIADGMPRGRPSSTILKLIQDHFRPGYPRGNLGPKLTAYKRDGLIEPINGVWKITEKGRKEISEN